MLLTPPTTSGFHATDPESFWIDMGHPDSGKVKKRETFVLETIKRLGAALTCPGLVRT